MLAEIQSEGWSRRDRIRLVADDWQCEHQPLATVLRFPARPEHDSWIGSSESSKQQEAQARKQKRVAFLLSLLDKGKTDDAERWAEIETEMRTERYGSKRA